MCAFKNNQFTQLCIFGYKVGWMISQLSPPHPLCWSIGAKGGGGEATLIHFFCLFFKRKLIELYLHLALQAHVQIWWQQVTPPIKALNTLHYTNMYIHTGSWLELWIGNCRVKLFFEVSVTRLSDLLSSFAYIFFLLDKYMKRCPPGGSTANQRTHLWKRERTKSPGYC